MIPIAIPRRQRLCLGCQTPFLPKNAYFSRLNLIKEREYERQDFCTACWQPDPRDAAENRSFWKGMIPPKTALEKKSDRFEKALESLKNLEGESEEDLKEAYLLALFLQRKKWLQPRGEFKRKGQDFVLYEVAATEELIEVLKMRLGVEDGGLQERIARKLHVCS